MAAIAYGILFARQKLWDTLDEKMQDNLADYLYAINEYSLPECNWVLFAVLVYELVGPALTKRSLLAVGEIKPEGRTSARILNATK